MENASKALIIAGSILISILLISLGIIMFNSSKGTTDQTSEVSTLLNSSASTATETIADELSKISNDSLIKFSVNVISHTGTCLKTIQYTTSKEMTWETFTTTSNNSDEYYKLITYPGGRVDVSLLADGVEAYGLRTQSDEIVRKTDKIIANQVYNAKAYNMNW